MYLTNFLPLRLHLTFCFFLAFFWILGLIFFFFLTFIFYSILWFLYRRAPLDDDGLGQEKRDCILAPCNGRIIDLEPESLNFDNGNFSKSIGIVVPPWQEGSLLLPTNGEVHDVKLVDRSKIKLMDYLKILRKGRFASKCSGICLDLRTDGGKSIGLEIHQSVLGSWPELSIRPGDRGRVQSLLGHSPLGSIVLVYLPEDYEIRVREGDEVNAGISILAGPIKKGENEHAPTGN